ncbi:MAG TPA: ribosome assembly RNA-binding protein YhbY [Burkholderiales bacterium]|nr:ribosome assembly RNA-binding protein YhbY [Burkholderiales bacterium]
MKELTSAARRALRARAHALRPTVMIGEAGLSLEVLAEIERSLQHHELIKIRVLGAGRDARDELASVICRETGAQPVQHIGRILVVYRENPPPPPPPPIKKTAAGTKVRRRPGQPLDLRASARRSDPHTTPPRRPRFERENRRKPRPR